MQVTIDTMNYGEVTVRNAMVGETDLYDITEIRGDDLDLDIEMFIPLDELNEEGVEELIEKYG